MSLKTELHNYLSGYAGLSALVDDNIYPDIAPENSPLPYVIFQIVSADHIRSMTAASDFVARRVQFDVYGSTALSVENVFDQLRGALEAKRGTIGSENLVVLSSGIDTERDDYVDPIDGSQTGKHRRTIDFIIWHRL